ncbi:MAG TPA: thioredoxin domain-containing protein, partial [Gemmataceae bacterium]|nr:thioredoxin domain-containing protein [Gemmataceae bacterium]
PPAGAPVAVAPAPAAPLVPEGPPVERLAVPADGPARGAASPKVTIVEFSDFQCPFCARANPTLDQIRATYPNDVRIVFRHNPLPFHQNAELAAEAAVLAEWQGKFWEMHDHLFANQADLAGAGLEQRAAELGMDVAAFRSALDKHAAKARVDADLALAQQLGVRGTPTFFVDGRAVMGAQPFAVFKQVIDDELARADSLLRQGVPREKLYATLIAGAASSVPKPSDASRTVYRVPTLDAPARGGAQPKVTLVEFGDFESPFCARVEATLATLLKSYGADLALVYRHNPQAFHPHGELAALASEAARAQGKFWEMHDKLYANATALDRESLDKYAAELGLDVARFKKDLDAGLGKDRMRRDIDDAQRFGAQTSPSFFINGRELSGNRPLEDFKVAIDEEMRKADKLLAAGTPRGDLYAASTKEGLDKNTPPPPPAAKPDPDAELRVRVDLAGAPARGPADAPVTIVEFADFQCPFCLRVEETLEKLRHDYPNDVRFVWRDLPLPFHDQAQPAALAARAAAAQGKFWAMHDRLFAAPAGTLGPERFAQDATELGLDLPRFRAALDAKQAKTAIDADGLLAARAGATGTPTFFINGKRLVGAQAYDSFKARIDGELKIAQEMIAKGTPRGKIYAALMKDALPVRPPPRVGADGDPPGPEADTTIYPVKPGDAPSRGPANAALTMIVFSDFQCPFCKRVEPTLAELQKHYGKKLRIVWKNYPLPFHPNAAPAAEAAMAADAQGKFWAMHDKLFANSDALDRANLERYAGELGLDLVRFKADLDAERYKTRIESDTREGIDVGVNGTPAVFINGRKIAGAYPLETFRAVADEELAKVEGKGKKTVAGKAR